MGFCQHCAVKVIAEFNDAWAEKLKKNQPSTSEISKENPWSPKHLRELNLCIDIQMPSNAIYISTFLQQHARSMHDVA